MALTKVEILALIFAIAIIVKILVVMVKPKTWLNFVEKAYKKLGFLIGFEFILSVVVLYILLNELSFVQIMASVVFGALLTGISFAIFSKEIVQIFLKMLKSKKLIKKSWLLILMWLALAVLILLEIFLL